MWPAKKARIVLFEGGLPPMSLRGFWAERTYVAGRETSFPISKPALISALQKALRHLSMRPLVSAGA